MNQKIDFTITKLGKNTVKSPIPYSVEKDKGGARFVSDDEFILPSNTLKEQNTDSLLEKAGPREMIYFNPNHVHAGIVTCGGLCPGLNDVIRAVVRTLWYRYGVQRITGVRMGYKGFLPEYNLPVKELNPYIVDHIHNMGGSILGSSRGGSDTVRIVDAMERMNLNILFTIGGDGTQRGALAITKEIKKRNLNIAVIGVPKTIDNDLSFIHKSFGFDTAVERAVEAVNTAHTEAKSAIDGVGLVKLMGRESGFIAAHTSLATSEVNFCLIPEAEFSLEGENGLLKKLEERLDARHHAVIVVAEGAGQNLLEASGETDESGNKRLADIGLFLKEKITAHFKKIGRESSLKYIDPGYMIRASAANPVDSLYCARLGANAVHAAMSGRTGMLISQWNNAFVHVPIDMAVSKKNCVDPEGSLWRDVIESTRQPARMHD
ncbi:ATP-dependent 6-phosphofructokinase [Spirochaeta isovalerica]|uniref:ATP-dependent 6-phosphofructokinase n=1 Tax=Spirochaeta isovalerica TaxID=150 RepID=A0A841R504_9SPIO|nr:ATP-dependent 6-phosphofructokinase [Spirochaeta isovalerica]MBB6478896.1 6-phosphofructokinase 1 [Spirochaeta isovalerica]